jgi:hypothetical protein
MSALLVLSDARVAQETRHAEAGEAAEAEWRRAWRWRVCWAGMKCGATYVAGGVLAFAGLALTGDSAQIALWGGLLLSNAGPLAFGYAFWMREQGIWEG